LSTLRERCRRIEDTTIDDAVAPSDPASIRSIAQRDDHRSRRRDDGGAVENKGDDDRDEADASVGNDDDVVGHVGVLPAARQGTAAVLETCEKIAVQNAPHDARDGGDDDDDDDDETADKKKELFELRRGEIPLDDYERFPQVLMDSLFPLFLTRRGLRLNRCISPVKFEQLALFYDNRHAQNRQLLFLCANTIRRHAANTGVAASVNANPAMFARFQRLLATPSFAERIAEAKANPDTDAARKVVDESKKPWPRSGEPRPVEQWRARRRIQPSRQRHAQLRPRQHLRVVVDGRRPQLRRRSSRVPLPRPPYLPSDRRGRSRRCPSPSRRASRWGTFRRP